MFGTDVGAVRRTRSFTGESGASVVTSKGRKAPEDAEPAVVTIEATLGTDGLYALTVEAEGQSTTVENVHPDELAGKVASLIHKVTKAVRAGDLKKHRNPEPLQLGMGTPRPNRSNLRFAS